MRKTSYVITFFAVLASLILNILSAHQTSWLLVKSSKATHHKVTAKYGLYQVCSRDVVKLPFDDRIAYTEYTCRKFPARVSDKCEEENAGFCTAWSTAGYASELAIGFVAITLFSILIGVSTGSRRRRIWRAVAGLVLFSSLMQVIAFAIVTNIKRTSRFEPATGAIFGPAYVMNVFSWVWGIVVAGAVITTGISADKGHTWAAGNRAYQPIEG
ncbi:hypothetical protein FISHEDRAFT_71971 [Fistulina hepatica ATCC 64428]|uniref:Uncharacterized protein n=1 Tax=Fistulina hepatica ATCC 64428 TaxID=1128425 RepID=A0A0D7AHQ7_9AGAR|nr:hypothetical protein FISHEDRAFT_71971 [Fistulina hepatica ATCC 64428]